MKATPTALLLVLVAGPLLRPAAAADDGERLVREARSAASAGKYADAAAALAKALDVRESYALRVELARDYVLDGQWPKAKAQYALAKRLDPRGRDAYIDNGYFSFAVDSGAGAETNWRALIAADPTDYIGYKHLGVYLRDAGRVKDGRAYLREALKRIPRGKPWEKIGVLIDLAGSFDWNSQRAEVEEVLKEGLEASKGLPSSRCHFLGALGELAAGHHQRSVAEKLFREAISLCAGSGSNCQRIDLTVPLKGMAELQIDEDRLSEARAPLDAAARLYRPFGPIDSQLFRWEILNLNDIAGLYRKMDKDAAAESVYLEVISFRRALESSAELMDAETGLGELRLKSGHIAEAQELFEDAARIAALRKAPSS